MKTTQLAITAILTVAFSFSALAAKPKNGTKKKTLQSASSSKLSRDVVFDGADVSGRYHSAGAAVAKVETDKQLNDLIGVRSNFKDRLNAEKGRLDRRESVGQASKGE